MRGLFNGKQSSYITVIGLIVVVIGIYGYFQPGNFSVPNAKATPSSYDFGRIDPKPVEKDFELGNTGDSTLRVSRVSTSCSCTTAEVSKEEIPAGNSATLKVNFDPRAMDPPISGKVMRIVYIETNDPDQEETEIEITANVSGGEQAENQ